MNAMRRLRDSSLRPCLSMIKMEIFVLLVAFKAELLFSYITKTVRSIEELLLFDPNIITHIPLYPRSLLYVLIGFSYVSFQLFIAAAICILYNSSRFKTTSMYYLVFINFARNVIIRFGGGYALVTNMCNLITNENESHSMSEGLFSLYGSSPLGNREFLFPDWNCSPAELSKNCHTFDPYISNLISFILECEHPMVTDTKMFIANISPYTSSWYTAAIYAHTCCSLWLLLPYIAVCVKDRQHNQDQQRSNPHLVRQTGQTLIQQPFRQDTLIINGRPHLVDSNDVELMLRGILAIQTANHSPGRVSFSDQEKQRLKAILEILTPGEDIISTQLQ